MFRLSRVESYLLNDLQDGRAQMGGLRIYMVKEAVLVPSPRFFFFLSQRNGVLFPWTSISMAKY